MTTNFLKTCARCKISKEAGMFTKSKQNRDGRHSYCTQCKSAETRARRQAAPDLYAARQAEADRLYKQRHPDKVRDVKRVWEKQNPEKHSAMGLRYRMKNREKLAQYARDYRARAEGSNATA